MRDFLPKCTRRDNTPLPIPANPCERTFRAVFLYERLPACAKGSDQDESCFLLPTLASLLEHRNHEGILSDLPSLLQKAESPNGTKSRTTSASSRKAFAGLQASSPYPSRNRQLSKMRHCAAHGQGTGCCNPGGCTDSLLGEPPRGARPAWLPRGGSHGVTHQQLRWSRRISWCQKLCPACQQPNTPPAHPLHPLASSASRQCQHEGYGQTRRSTAQTGHGPPAHRATNHHLPPSVSIALLHR